jgi:hypothetical protein
VESERRPSRRLEDEGDNAAVIESGGGGAADKQGGGGSDYVKPNAAASETTASDRRASGGGVIGTLAKAYGSVLAAQWGEAANKEHRGDVFGWWPWAEMEVPCVCGGQREWRNHPRVHKKYFP